MPDKVTKFVLSLDQKTRMRLQEKIALVLKDPFSLPGVKKLTGSGKNLYRIRMGNIRIIYAVMDGMVEIRDIDYRGNIY